jgi:acyl carrier protein
MLPSPRAHAAPDAIEGPHSGETSRLNHRTRGPALVRVQVSGLAASMNSNMIDSTDQVDPALVQELAHEMVQALNLDVTADEIDPKAPLYGDGLGLDSIDILEVALVVSRKYGFQLRANDEGNVRIFSSLESLARHVALHRTK